MAYSASAKKTHGGERGPQQAADAGADEWGDIWDCLDEDNANERMDDIEEYFDGLDGADPLPLINLPPSIQSA